MQRRHRDTVLSLLCVLSLPFGTACSISNSSETLSDSISSPFEWSSSSSPGGGSAYREDVSDYTVAYAKWSGPRAGGSQEVQVFRAGMSRLALHRGISNWEEDAITCASVGQGLQLADVDEAVFEQFAASVFGADAGKLRNLRAGYEATVATP
jgi:hypothetical protein